MTKQLRTPGADPDTDAGPIPVVSKAEQQADNAVKLEMIESTCTRCGRLIAHVAYCADCMARAENPNRSKPFTLNYDQWEEKKPCLFSSECGKYNNQDQCREPCDAYGRWLALPHEDPPDCWGLKQRKAEENEYVRVESNE